MYLFWSSVVSSCSPDLYYALVIHSIINPAFLSGCAMCLLILLTWLILQRNALKPLVKHGILEWMTPSVFFSPSLSVKSCAFPLNSTKKTRPINNSKKGFSYYYRGEDHIFFFRQMDKGIKYKTRYAFAEWKKTAGIYGKLFCKQNEYRKRPITNYYANTVSFILIQCKIL